MSSVTVSNTGVLSITGGAGVTVDHPTGDVTVSATGGGGGGLTKLFDNTPGGMNLPGGVQGIFAFDVPDDGLFHTLVAGLMVSVFAGPVTCQVGWSTQSGLLPDGGLANIVLFDLVAVPTGAWVLGNAGGLLLPGDGGQLNLNLLEGSGGGAQVYAQVWCTA